LPVVDVAPDDAADDDAQQNLGPRGPGAGRGPVLMPNRAPAPPQGAETIDKVRPIADRIVFGTSSGRVVALELASGQLAWQTRVAETGFEQLLATDDFIAVRQ